MMHDGNEMQNRIILDQAVKMAIASFRLENPELFVDAAKKPEAEIPSPLKWAAGILAALFSAMASGVIIWAVASISSMQITLARVEERLTSMDRQQTERITGIEVRIARLEEKKNAAPPPD